MRKFLDSFRLTTREKRGFFLVLIMLGLLLVFPLIRSFVQSSDQTPLPYTLIAFAEAEESVHPADRESESYGLIVGGTVTATVGELFYFDPNNLPVASWKKLGLSDRQIQVIKNYESKGGKFYKKEDVKKLYSISDEFYQRIEPYIQMSSANVGGPREYAEDVVRTDEAVRFKRREIPIIDINQADTSSWRQLRGIGPVFAERIVRFRDGLGGFHRVDQLQEVYGLSDELYQQILPFLTVGDYGINKIKINTVDKDQLQKHPYISPRQAAIIIKYRHQHGSYPSLEEMRKIIVLDDDFLRKIEPYLDFDP